MPGIARVVLAVLLPSLTAAGSLAEKPPLGWNSWDCWGGPGSQAKLYSAAAAFRTTMLPVGYDTMVVDMGWYFEGGDSIDFRALKQRSWGANSSAPAALLGQAMHIDKWGRLTANPKLWPDGISGAVKHLHSLGIKMGVHVMRGVNIAAVAANSPILDPATGKASGYTAAQLLTSNNESCQWCSEFKAVNTSHPAAKLWYASNAALYQDFGVDFLKGDCFYGKRDETAAGKPPFSGVDPTELLMFADSIAASSAAGEANTRPITISLSPGVDADTAEAAAIHSAVNMYRVTDDLHDCWNNESTCDCGDGIRVTQAFEQIHRHEQAGLVGAAGFDGKSWPDLDMLPVGPLEKTNALTDGEQRVAMTLWSVSRAPMVVGTDLTKLCAPPSSAGGSTTATATAATVGTTSSVDCDANATATITNPEVLQVGQQSTQSFQLSRSGPSGAWGAGAHIAWVAMLPHKTWALAFFNIGDAAAVVSVPLAAGKCSVRDLWGRVDAGSVSGGNYSRQLAPHTAAFVTMVGGECHAPARPPK